MTAPDRFDKLAERHYDEYLTHRFGPSLQAQVTRLIIIEQIAALLRDNARRESRYAFQLLRIAVNKLKEAGIE